MKLTKSRLSNIDKFEKFGQDPSQERESEQGESLFIGAIFSLDLNGQLRSSLCDEAENGSFDFVKRYGL